MINIETIRYNEPIYYVPTYGGSVRVSVIQLTDNGNVIVKSMGDKSQDKPYCIPVKFLFKTGEAARKQARNWESWKRKSKHNKQQLHGYNKKYSVIATNGQKYFFNGSQHERITNAKKWCKKMGYELLLFASNNPSGTFAIKDSNGEIIKKCYTVKQLQMYVKQQKSKNKSSE